MSTLKVDQILKRTGTGTITLGQSGDTIAIPSGATISNSGTATGFGGDGTPKFYAKKNADQTGITDHAMTKVTFQTEEFDSDNAFDNSTNYRFTVPSGEGGLYFIGFNFIGARDNQTKNVRGQIHNKTYRIKCR